MDDRTYPSHAWLSAHHLEDQVRELMRHRAARDVAAVHTGRLTVGERMADRLADVAGSWGFIGGFMGFLALWIALNVIGALHHWDPYPFILLNLLLSCIAAIQAPVIMMSQNRQEARDRLRAEADYEVNVKAEILLEHLTQEVEALKAAVAALGDARRVQRGEGDSR